MIWTMPRKKACSSTNRPDIEMMVSTKNMALVTGLRLNGFATTKTPHNSVRAANT